MAMKHFIIFETKSHDKLSLPIEDIGYLDSYTQKYYTTIHVGEVEYYVIDSIEDIVKRINQIVYGTEK
jgi:hypothetical protein